MIATASQEQDFLFGSDSRILASYYIDASYGQMTWTGTNTLNYTIADPGTCNLAGLANQKEVAATGGGYKIASYRALMINAPQL